jgi:hypothetical protein
MMIGREKEAFDRSRWQEIRPGNKKADPDRSGEGFDFDPARNAARLLRETKD